MSIPQLILSAGESQLYNTHYVLSLPLVSRMVIYIIHTGSDNSLATEWSPISLSNVSIVCNSAYYNTASDSGKQRCYLNSDSFKTIIQNYMNTKSAKWTTRFKVFNTVTWCIYKATPLYSLQRQYQQAHTPGGNTHL